MQVACPDERNGADTSTWISITKTMLSEFYTLAISNEVINKVPTGTTLSLFRDCIVSLLAHQYVFECIYNLPVVGPGIALQESLY